jgi:hypothetical protein
MTEAPHPLESIVWEAFAEHDCLDAMSLSWVLKDHPAGQSSVRIKRGPTNARRIARDVLSYMEKQGLIERDQIGWYHKVQRD